MITVRLTNWESVDKLGRSIPDDARRTVLETEIVYVRGGGNKSQQRTKYQHGSANHLAVFELNFRLARRRWTDCQFMIILLVGAWEHGKKLL